MKNQCLRNFLYSQCNCHIPFGTGFQSIMVYCRFIDIVSLGKLRAARTEVMKLYTCINLSAPGSSRFHLGRHTVHLLVLSVGLGLVVAWSWLSPPLRMVAAQLRTMMSPLSTRPPRSSPPVWSLFSASFLFQHFTPHPFQALIFGDFWVNIVEICNRYLYTVSFFSCPSSSIPT